MNPLGRNPLGLLLRATIFVYRCTLSPLIGPTCRYAPSCSAYAGQAIGVHGPIAGTWLAVKRVARCHPWGGDGWDPVPPRRMPE
ncbi:MAG: membrane protein insertion efficiency factor YidD [Pseudomonadota bacterium]